MIEELFMSKKSIEIKKFKENPPISNGNRVAIKYLFKRLETYINRVKYRRSDDKTAHSEVYRNLCYFAGIVHDHIDYFESELVKLLKEKEEIFFPETQEKVVKEDGKISIKYMDGRKDWKKAYEQFEIENESDI